MIVFYHGWLKELKKYPGDIKGCKLVCPFNVINHAGGTIDPDGKGFHIGAGCLDLGQWEFCYEPLFVTFAAVYIKNKVIRKVGLLDEKFLNGYFDDVDYCLRARKAGFKIVYTPTTLIHLESLSFGAQDNSKEIFNKNPAYFRQKWLLKEKIPEILVNKTKKFLSRQLNLFLFKL